MVKTKTNSTQVFHPHIKAPLAKLIAQVLKVSAKLRLLQHGPEVPKTAIHPKHYQRLKFILRVSLQALDIYRPLVSGHWMWQNCEEEHKNGPFDGILFPRLFC